MPATRFDCDERGFFLLSRLLLLPLVRADSIVLVEISTGFGSRWDNFNAKLGLLVEVLNYSWPLGFDLRSFSC